MEPAIKPPRQIWSKPDPNYSELLKKRVVDSRKLALTTIRETQET